MKKTILVVMLILSGLYFSVAEGQVDTEGVNFPNRTIENIFPWGPGGAFSASQIIASAMGEEIGESIVVVSTPGAAGTKAFQTALNRPSDGYTIIDGYVAPLVMQPILGNAEWTYKDFKPLYAAVSNAFAIACNVNESRWHDFEEMMEYGRKNPGKLRYTSYARNNLPHMVIAKILQFYGVVAQHIPYTEAEANKDLKAGLLDFSFVNVAGYVQDPTSFNILLVLSEMPDASSAYGGAASITDLDIDLGLSGLGPMGWTWWVVSPDTPDNVTEILRVAMKKTMAREEVRAKIKNLGFVPLEWGPEKYEEVVGSVHEQLSAMQNALAWEREALAELKDN